MTSGPYSLSALYRDAQFSVQAGEAIVGNCKSAGQHYFCKSCFSWAYTKPSGLEGMVNIRTSLLERAAEFPPFAEFYCDEGFADVSSGAELTFGTAPSPEDFLKLADAYASWEKRPG